MAFGPTANSENFYLVTTTIYYIRLEGSNQIYSIHSSVYPEIVFATIGDSLNISYVKTESTIIPIVEIN